MYALILGRFQVPNKTLKKMIEKAKKEGVKDVLIIVTSSNEYGTDKNPLSVMLRQHLISEITADDENVIITGLEDSENDEIWKKNVMELSKEIMKEYPSIYISGDKDPTNFEGVKTIKIKREKITDDDVWKAILRDDKKEKERILDKELIKSFLLHPAAIYLYKIKVKGDKDEIYNFDFRNPQK